MQTPFSLVENLFLSHFQSVVCVGKSLETRPDTLGTEESVLISEVS